MILRTATRNTVDLLACDRKNDSPLGNGEKHRRATINAYCVREPDESVSELIDRTAETGDRTA